MESKNPEQGVRNKFTWITFISSIMVMYIHSYNLYTYGLDENALGFGHVVYLVERFCKPITDQAVPLFFLVSGILFFRTFEINLLLKKWKNRRVTVVIPYLFWASFYYLFDVVCKRLPVVRDIMTGTEWVPFSVSTWVDWLWVSSYNILWFLKNLMVFILLTPLIWLILKNHAKKIPTGFIGLLILLSLFHLGKFEIPYSGGFDVYLVGSYIGLNAKELLFYRNRKLSIASMVYIALMLATSLRFLNFVTEILFYFAMWFALDMLPVARQKLPWWMSITFFTYVAHEVVLETLEKVVYKVSGANPVFALLDYIVMPWITLTILVGLAYLLKKWLPRFWGFITGAR